jgi:chromosomal replication initiator protein
LDKKVDVEKQQNLWQQTINSLKSEFEEQYWFYLDDLNVSFTSENNALITASSSFIKDTVKNKFLSKISDFLCETLNSEILISLEVRKNSPLEQQQDTQKNNKTDTTARQNPAIKASNLEQPQRSPQKRDTVLNLNDQYTFESYVSDDSSQYSYAVSQSVALNPGLKNPLFIYGGVGLGKTHLLQAIGNYVYVNSDAKIIYTTAEAFTTDFIESLRKNNMPLFKKNYRQADYLLIDDIHFLKKNMMDTQEELFNTFNALINAKKQMVFTCDRPAVELKELNERLSSRLGQGIQVSLQMPSFETRCAILRKRVETTNINVPDEVIELVSKNISSNVRDLIAALNKIVSYAELLDKEITLNVAHDLLKEYFNSSKQPNISPETIQKLVADHFSLSIKDLKNKNRKQNIVHPRHLSMFLIRELTEYSTTEIGNYFGRDHSSVIHAIKNIEERKRKDPQEEHTIQELTRIIKENCLK